MLLLGVAKRDGWLYSEWQLTYGVGWDSILNAVYCVFDKFENPELLTEEGPIDIKNARDIRNIPEAGSLTVRGMSKIYGAPLMTTFFNQTRSVELWIPQDGGEFKDADYESFNKSMCEYADSIELSMYKLEMFTE